MTLKIALMGAGGKMGCRITDNIKDLADYEMRYIEVSPAGLGNLAQRGLAATPQAEAIADADAVVLAVPDRLIGRITTDLVPQLRPGAMLIGLDPAAAYAGVMPLRDDLTYFVVHPCHPMLFNGDTDPKKINDWFGGIYASQHVVCALFHGPEADYATGEALSIAMFGNPYGPVLGAHRVTVEQMAMLEPALVETFAATLITAIDEMKEYVIAKGVPREAAEPFVMGHLRTMLAIVFGFAGFPFSDGARLAIEKARARIFQPTWKENIMDIGSIQRSVAEITDSLK